jgi:3-hydroxyacyl-CoA dehydrogenase
MSISSIGIVGAGPAGIGIAIACAAEGYPVVLMRAAHAEGGRSGMSAKDADSVAQLQLNRRVALHAYGRLDAESVYASVLAQILLVRSGTLSMHDALAAADLVIDATYLGTRTRRAMLATLESQLSAGAVLASGARPDELSELAQALSRPDQFVGVQLVARAGEPIHLASLPETAPGVQAACRAFAASLRRPVAERQSVPPPVRYREWLTSPRMPPTRSTPEAAE